MLVQNKKTGLEYTVTDEEWADIVKNKLNVKYNILSRNAGQSKEKSTATVEVLDFVKKHTPKNEPIKKESQTGLEVKEPIDEQPKVQEKIPKSNTLFRIDIAKTKSNEKSKSNIRKRI